MVRLLWINRHFGTQYFINRLDTIKRVRKNSSLKVSLRLSSQSESLSRTFAISSVSMSDEDSVVKKKKKKNSLRGSSNSRKPVRGEELECRPFIQRRPHETLAPKTPVRCPGFVNDKGGCRFIRIVPSSRR